jgi:hypothetical protein
MLILVFFKLHQDLDGFAPRRNAEIKWWAIEVLEKIQSVECCGILLERLPQESNVERAAYILKCISPLTPEALFKHICEEGLSHWRPMVRFWTIAAIEQNNCVMPAVMIKNAIDGEPDSALKNRLIRILKPKRMVSVFAPIAYSH